MARYNVNNYSFETLLSSIKSGDIAIIHSAGWYFNVRTMCYLLTIDGKESG